MPDLRSRIAGAFYGLLTGDAFGCPVEGYTPDRIRREFGRLTDMVPATGQGRPPGLHSDDGQQAIAVCDAVLEDPRHPGPVFARLIVDMFLRGPGNPRVLGVHRGAGENFRETVQALAGGRAWDRAARPTAGNGAAMRVAPAGLYHRDDAEALLDAVFDVSRVTHADPRGLAAAGAIAFLVANAVHHEGRARDLADRDLLTFVYAVEDRAVDLIGIPAHHREFSNGLDVVLATSADAREDVLRQIEIVASRAAGQALRATDGFAPASVLTALTLFLQGKDFESTLIDAVMLGGDADTIGAMVGALSGALYGVEAIPVRWRNALSAYGALEDRIDALVKRTDRFTPAVPVADLEKPWTEMYLRGAL